MLLFFTPWPGRLYVPTRCKIMSLTKSGLIATRHIFLRLALMRFQPKLDGRKVSGVISYDLLSDFHPKGLVAERYGVTRDGGITERAILFLSWVSLVLLSSRRCTTFRLFLTTQRSGELWKCWRRQLNSETGCFRKDFSPSEH